ncbi:MAG: hypothetical protein A2413_19040 [Treponema sp. RIFOXYC1_FULL_61_9]|nr:MAG: hypothetical protein A2413_19040 [Treponema sp. RIFOXYC1_FULL_61_9]
MEATAAIAALVLILWASSFLYFRSYLRKRTGVERILSDLREETGKLIAEIDAATDRDVTLVEDRVKALRALIEDADKRVSNFAREVERRGAEERAYSELGRRARRYQPSHEPALGDLPESSAARTPSAAPVPVLVPPTPAAPAESELPPAPRFRRSETEIVPKNLPFPERVAELHRAGFSADLIAKRLRSTVAEVDLAIALAGRMDGTGADDSGY